MSLIDEIQSYLKAVSPFNETAYTKMPKRLLKQSVEEITRLNTFIDQIGIGDTAKMQLLQADIDALKQTSHCLNAENQKLRELLNIAAGLLFRLEEYKCIQTDDEEFEDQLDHWREIGLGVVAQASALLNANYK